MINPLPLVSIITPSFKSQRTIAQTIESVLNQTYPNIEYIVIDGASTDGSLEIIKSYEKDFKEKKMIYQWISEPDKGISDAFNKGIKQATGELIGIINSDDWLDRKSVQFIVENMDKRYSIYCGNLGLYDNNSEFLKIRKSRPYLLPLGMYMNHPTVFIKREVYCNDMFDLDLKIAMDYDILLRIRRKGYKIKSINRVISNMRIGGVSCDIDKMRLEEKMVMKKNLSFIMYRVARLKLRIEEVIIKYMLRKENKSS